MEHSLTEGYSNVLLDGMDGFEFQRFVAHLFEKLGYGHTDMILTTNDGGQDIVMHSHGGDMIVIECKHHPKGTIGRPALQKLHSAVVTANAKRGFLVTTGHFSQQAIAYNEGLGGFRGTLRKLKTAINDTGSIVIGEPYYFSKDVPAELRESEGDFRTEGEILDIIHDEGCKQLFVKRASHNECNNY